jgi:hypothetical protein
MNNDEKKTTGKTLRQILLSAQGISQEKIRASLKTRPDADCQMAMAAFTSPPPDCTGPCEACAIPS